MTENTAADDILDCYQFESLEQLRAASDELRVAMLALVTTKPMTVTQVGEALGQAPAKIHYHMRELERVGLVRLVATREKGGILEKYFRAIARSFDTSPALFQQPARDSLASVARDILQQRVEAFVRATRAAAERARAGDDSAPARWLGINITQLWMSPDEMRHVMQGMGALLHPYEVPRGGEGEREYTLAVFMNDTRAGQAPADRSAAGEREQLHRVVAAGAITYTRADLEAALARGERLDLDVLGACAFSDDVTPDLVRRAIARFRFHGVLSAPTEVRTALDALRDTGPTDR